jgi:hypothetical protein
MLAIVIPYFNFIFFEDTLKSLAHQTDKRFNVYIGDDASPEDPSDLLEKFQGQFEFLYHRFETNLGGISLTQQWERCIALSGDEEWLMILGDDDYVSSNLVCSFYTHFEKFDGNANVLRFSKQIIFEKSKTISEIQSHPIWERASDSYYKRLIGLTTSSLSEYIFTKEVYDKYKFYDFPLAWHSDDRAWLEFTENKPIYTINVVLVSVRNSFVNITGRSDNRDIKKQTAEAFFNFLVKEKLYLFDKKQSIRILTEYENTIKKVRKININDKIRLLPYYIKYFDLKIFRKFLKNFLKTIIDKK